ncbi:MAG: hypothetical protein ACK5XN_17815, partial [Bacteroidota bacterium]
FITYIIHPIKTVALAVPFRILGIEWVGDDRGRSFTRVLPPVGRIFLCILGNSVLLSEILPI